MRSIRLLLVLAAAALTLSAAAAPLADAADTHAPKGARLDWLPSSEWVMSEWLPYDQQRLQSLLGVTRDDLAAWLDDHRTLGQLAATKGFHSQRALAARLVAPRLPQVSRTMRRVLEERALATLTQAHLARHVLFHIFHTPAIPDGAPAVFGVSAKRFRTLRDAANTPTEIGQIGGKTPAQVHDGLLALLKRRAARGVALGAMSARQAAFLNGEQAATVDLYTVRHFRTPDQQVSFLCHPH